MSDETIVEKLNEKLNRGILNSAMENIAKICIDALKNGNEDDKKRARAMVKPFFVPFRTPSINENKEADRNKEFRETAERAMRYANEIRYYLGTKDLTPYLTTNLKIIFDTLTKDGATYEDLANACTLYEVEYKTAVEVASEHIKPEGNGFGNRKKE